jgi:hypothetical protein
MTAQKRLDYQQTVALLKDNIDKALKGDTEAGEEALKMCTQCIRLSNEAGKIAQAYVQGCLDKYFKSMDVPVDGCFSDAALCEAFNIEDDKEAKDSEVI